MRLIGEGNAFAGTPDRVRGILFGLCAGDQIGGPTRMALELAEYLLTCGRVFRREELLERYVSWFVREGFDTGPVAERVFTLVARGIPSEQAVLRTHEELRRQTAGCNPAHRAVPLAMSAHLRDEELPALARQEAKLTHWDPIAGDVSAAVVVLCRALVRGEQWQAALHKAARHCGVCNLKLEGGAPDPPLSRSGFAPEVLRAAVFFVGDSSDPATALTRSFEFAGPANYCPVLVGAIAGARWGASRIPPSLLRSGPILERVHRASDALAASWQAGAGTSA